MTKTSSSDPVMLYGRLDPVAEPNTRAFDNRGTVALFERITSEHPREQQSTASASRAWHRWGPTGLKLPILIVAPVMAALLVAVLALSVLAPIGTSSAVAEVQAAAATTAALESGRISTVFTAYAGAEQVGISSVDYRFFEDDFDYQNRVDADMIDYLQGVDLGEFVEEELGAVESDEISIEPETLIREVDGVSYLHDGASWSRWTVPGADLGDIGDRSLAATHATDELVSCEGPVGFDSYCGTSDDLEVIAALLLMQPQMLTADTQASIQIDIDSGTGLVHTVRARLTSEREAEVAGLTHTEATVTLTDLGTGQPIEAPSASNP